MAELQDGMDPEIAALLGASGNQAADEPVPDLNDFSLDLDMDTVVDTETPAVAGVDLTAEHFPPITKKLEDVPHNAFQDANYYKTALSGEGDITQRVHGVLQKYLNAKDPKDKGVFRQQFTPAFWEFLTSVARKTPGKLVDPKKYLLRFGILHPAFLEKEVSAFFAKIVVDNTLNQPVYYLDEWLKAVGTGVIRNSSTDEAQVGGGGSAQSVKLQQLLEKAKGKQDGNRALLKAKNDERTHLEQTLVERISHIANHQPLPSLHDIGSCYNEAQKRLFVEAQDLMKALIKTNNAMETMLRDYQQAEEDTHTLMAKLEEEGGTTEVTVDVKAVDTEFGTIRQMAKMTVGRQGNHFPVLTSEYYHSQPHEVGTRENIIALLAWVESIDSEAFCRMYKNKLNRIVPYVVLIPSYGDTGFCWEPFDRFNRATSRGRIAVPMYPRNLPIAVLTAVADLRWQVAKEKASYYWMEEGITGNYYQWFQKMKLKGDLKASFIGDYILWMTKESEGTQKLDKELRGVFWRHLPFSQPIKDKLKTRSYVYQELCQRDVNRTMSDGY